mmetsp:Transcript_21182/g.44471  ORF Transcript_21182/g.44471 Transcript_21182/m.44471 type:complete len:288 (+) Transcript_21182:56-919(+)
MTITLLPIISFTPSSTTAFIKQNNGVTKFANRILPPITKPIAHNGVLNAFTPSPEIIQVQPNPNALSSLPALLTSVNYFDGSEISNAVVVSNTFWSTLSSKLPALLLAEVLASLTFVVIASFVAAQGKFIIDRVASNVENERIKKGFSATPPLSLDFTKLLLCIIIDIIGSANEAIPIVGELVDVVYAPIAALLLRQLFSGSNVIFLLEFAEEILPFTDVLPLATICWVVESFFGGGSLARLLRVGEFSPDRGFDNDVIDINNDMESVVDDGKNVLLKSEEIESNQK